MSYPKLSKLFNDSNKYVLSNGLFQIQIYRISLDADLDNNTHFNVDIRSKDNDGCFTNINFSGSPYKNNNCHVFDLFNKYLGTCGSFVTYSEVPLLQVYEFIKLACPEALVEQTTQPVQVAQVKLSPIEAPDVPCAKCGCFDKYNMRYPNLNDQVLCYNHC